MKRMKGVLAGLVLCALVPMTLFAATAQQNKVVKQVGGSDGDSVTAGPDTSAARTIPAGATGWWVVGVSDSTMRMYTEVSPDGSNWFRIDTDSTTAASSANVTADFGQTYAGMQVRVITDQIPTPKVTDFSAAYIYTVE